MGICQFVKESCGIMAETRLKNKKNLIDTFMKLRYHVMSELCPHDTSSVEQANLDFFEKAYEHILGTVPLQKSEPGRPLSDYDKNYIRWIKQAQSEK
jgi:hypothetical protein